MDDANQLGLLLAPAAQSQSRLALARDTLQHADRPPSFAAEYMRADGRDPNDLTLQGWALVVPAGERGHHLCRLMRPLIERRSQQQGREAAVYPVPQPADAAMGIGGAQVWLDDHWRTAHRSPEDEPYYVLILGDLDEVPLVIQQVLSIRSLVGRLAFARDEEYTAYVEKVLAWEDRAHGSQAPTAADAVLYTVHDDTAGHGGGGAGGAVQVGFDGLVRPTHDMLGHMQKLRTGTLRLAGSECAPSPDELLAVADTAQPTVMLSLSHGHGVAAGHGDDLALQRRLQGAVHFGNAGPLTGEDLAKVRFLPGGVWFMQACFGAGTPASSAYYPWLAQLKEHGYHRRDIEYVLECLPRDGRPFISAIAKAVLANPQGPLAFIGHIDLAWTYSFNDLHRHGSGRRHRRLGDALVPLLAGARVGNSLAALIGHFNEVQTELECEWANAASRGARGSNMRPRRADVARVGRLWMLRQDLFAYVLLGDPAVRLPLAQEVPGTGQASRSRLPGPARPLPAVPGTPLQPVTTPPAVPGTSDEGFTEARLATLERAINTVLSRSGKVRDQDVRAASREMRRLELRADELRHFINVYRNAGLAALRKEPHTTMSECKYPGKTESTAQSQSPSPAHTQAVATPEVPDTLVFNGVDGVNGGYLIPPLSLEEFADVVAQSPQPDGEELEHLQEVATQAKEGAYLPVSGIDCNNLAQAGWAVIFPHTVPGTPAHERVLEIRAALAPLLDLRRAQAGALYREIIGSGEGGGYRGSVGDDPNSGIGESKDDFLYRLGAGPGSVEPEVLPYYVLIVGSPVEIPFAVQYQLDVQYAVGRLHFADVADYAHYAESVVAAETSAAENSAAITAPTATFFAPVNPNDLATKFSRDHLVAPLADYVGDRFAGAWHVERILRQDADKATLRQLLGGSRTPALLFTASHGFGLPCGHREQTAAQGALVCQDWGGPIAQHVEPAHYFAAADLAEDADLRGTIAFSFACFGAGTAAEDDFATYDREVRGRTLTPANAPAPFVAALPQRMLAQAGGRGALAVIGHVGRAWAASFQWSPARAWARRQDPKMFKSALTGLMLGHRAGYALDPFHVRYAEMVADIHVYRRRLEHGQATHAPQTTVAAEFAYRWMCAHDARNYAIIGDPAVRLSVAP